MSSYDAAIIDSEILEHPDLLELSRGTRLLNVEAIVWSRLHHTDGRIPAHMLSRITDEPEARSAAAQLVECGRWTMTASGWQIVDFLDKQMSAERVKQKREDAKKRYDEWQARQAKRVTKRVANDTDLTRPDLTRTGREGVGGNGVGLEAAPAASDIEKRRALAKSIREAPPRFRSRFLETFEREWAEVYPRPRPKPVAQIHAAVLNIVRETWAAESAA